MKLSQVQSSQGILAAGGPPVVKATVDSPPAEPVDRADAVSQETATGPALPPRHGVEVGVTTSLAPPLAGPAIHAASRNVKLHDLGMASRTANSPLVLHPRPEFNVFGLMHDFYLGEMLDCCGLGVENEFRPSVVRWRRDLDDTRQASIERTASVVHDYLFDVVVHEMWSGSRLDGTWQQHAPAWCRHILEQNHDNQRDYSELRSAIQRQHLTYGEFSTMAREFFLLPGWRKDYGGEPWAKLADLLGTLEPDRASIWLDTVFHTEHNTNSVFNKGGTGLPEGDLRDDGLKALLDYKRYKSNPREFSDLVQAKVEPDPDKYTTRPMVKLLQRAEVLNLAP